MINKVKIKDFQFINLLEYIYKQYNTACFVILKRGGGCIGSQQGSNQCLKIYKSIGIYFQAVRYSLYYDIKKGWGLHW